MPQHYSRYRKHFGQHFLNNKRLAKKIVDFAQIQSDTVLEIGAGKGILTEGIAKITKKLYAIEIDQNLCQKLYQHNWKNVEIINEDFLKLDLRNFPGSTIIGNIPYSITTPILKKVVNECKYIEKAILTIQKEYGDRILARVGTHQYGSITLYLNYHFDIKKGFIIRKNYFSPAPKVDSVVISFIPKPVPFLLKNKKNFFNFVKGIFCYRRKLMKNALKNYLHNIPEGIDKTLLNRRPEDLDLTEFYEIYSRYE